MQLQWALANANFEVARPILELVAVVVVILILATVFNGFSRRRDKTPAERPD